MSSLKERLDQADRPVLGVLLALIRAADDRGHLSLGELVREYRNQVHDRQGGEGPEPPDLAEGVLTRIQDILLPALLKGGWIEDTGDRGWDRVRAEQEWWSEVGQDRTAICQTLVERLAPARVPSWAPVGPIASPSRLSAEGLNKAFKRRRVVKEVSLALGQGEVVALLGPNGAGKTTTFYLITGLIRPDAGRILLDEVDITSEPMYRRARAGIGYLAQEPSVFRKLTVEENVLAILETLPLTKEERRTRLDALLGDLGIAHLRKVKAYALSGGERRRLELTRALATDPKFMLLDEPFAGVDPIAVHDIQTIVTSLKDRGIGVLITDHSVEQTLEIVDRAYIMFEGSVQAAGTVHELVFNDEVSDLYLGPTLTARLRSRLEMRV